MMRHLHILVLLWTVACGDNIDENGVPHGWDDVLTEWLTSSGALHGTVYRCESGAMCAAEDSGPPTEEWCWPGREEDLEAALGLGPSGCWEIEADERFWPWLVGCAYGCPLPGDGRGCNAHCGCFCP